MNILNCIQANLHGMNPHFFFSPNLSSLHRGLRHSIIDAQFEQQLTQ